MSRPGTDRLKVNPPLGVMAVLQYALPSQLMIDPDYQRSIDDRPSQSLIRKIAQYWDWALCLPLVVSRRRDTGEMFVIDGQHRLAAARLRGDIQQLPCVVGEFASKADEAASFVHLNQQRRALGKLDIFKAALASGDNEARGITDALREANLTIASSTNPDSWKPGMLVNIGGIERAWRKNGPVRTRAALQILARALDGEVMRYAGTIFPGLAALVAELTAKRDALIWVGREEAQMLVEMIGDTGQAEWRKLVAEIRAEDPNVNFANASIKAIADSWAELQAALAGDDEDEEEKAAFQRKGVAA